MNCRAASPGKALTSQKLELEERLTAAVVCLMRGLGRIVIRTGDGVWSRCASSYRRSLDEDGTSRSYCVGSSMVEVRQLKTVLMPDAPEGGSTSSSGPNVAELRKFNSCMQHVGSNENPQDFAGGWYI